jgi:hypothetical protein
MKEFASSLSNVQPKSPFKGGLCKGGARKILQPKWIHDDDIHQGVQSILWVQGNCSMHLMRG